MQLTMDYTPPNRKPQKVVRHTPIRGDVRRKKRDVSETTHYFPFISLLICYNLLILYRSGMWRMRCTIRYAHLTLIQLELALPGPSEPSRRDELSSRHRWEIDSRSSDRFWQVSSYGDLANSIPTFLHASQQQSQPSSSVWGCLLCYHRDEYKIRVLDVVL